VQGRPGHSQAPVPGSFLSAGLRQRLAHFLTGEELGDNTETDGVGS
jgi:hypothetical protein